MGDIGKVTAQMASCSRAKTEKRAWQVRLFQGRGGLEKSGVRMARSNWPELDAGSLGERARTRPGGRLLGVLETVISRVADGDFE